MKTKFKALFIAAILFHSYLYFKMDFDLTGCLLGLAFVRAILFIEQKKSEPASSDS